jgi:putative restriction endonuclease
VALDDSDVRSAVFAWLDERVADTGNLLSRRDLLNARVAGSPLGLIDAGRGIRNPSACVATLSLVSVPDSPYEDVDDGSGLVRYAFRRGDPSTGDNRKLLEAVRRSVPLVYFIRVEPSVYSAIYPVYAVEELPAGAGVLLDLSAAGGDVEPLGVPASGQRRYAASVARRRLHQVMFRGRVLTAYERMCSMCRLEEPALLDASHIVDDAVGGEPVVQNGLALCSIHHRAFDRDLIGVSPDDVIHVRARLLKKVDGPMLRHGLQELNGRQIHLPRRRSERPQRELLEQRYERFRAAC